MIFGFVVLDGFRNLENCFLGGGVHFNPPPPLSEFVRMS